MISEFLNIVRALGDYCTSNFQKGDKVQMQADGAPHKGIEKIEPFGFRSHVPKATRGFKYSIGAQLKDSVFLGILTSLLNKVALEEGEVEIYSTLHQQSIVLNSTGQIVLRSKPDQPIQCIGNLEVTGNITATGDITDATSSMQSMRDTYNSHTHTGDSGGSTGAPSDSM
jgi:phage gp45-like